MKIRFASALLALALPLCAQDPQPSSELLFYKAFYLEKKEMDYAGAMVLYEQFLAAAPEHALAKQAAEQQYRLLDKVGKTKERDAFKARHEKLLADVVLGDGDRPARPEAETGRRGDGAGRGPAARGDAAARLAELEKELARAKEEGDEERVRQLEQQMQRIRQLGERGRGRPALFGDKKLADMSKEEIDNLKSSLGMFEPMIDRYRQREGDEKADQLESHYEALTKALDAGELEDAQKALDSIRSLVQPRRQRGDGRGRGDGEGRGGRGDGEGRGGR